MPLDPQIQSLVDNLPDGIALPVGDPVVARDTFRRLTVALRDSQPPASLAAIEDLEVPAAGGRQLARIYRADVEQSSPTMLFIHGGGFVVGDIESYDLTARTIAERTATTVISVEYGLAPEHPYPEGLKDVLAIAGWTLENIEKLGGDRSRTIIAGDSAGGNLAAVAAQQLRQEPSGFAGQVLLYPVVDFANTYPSRTAHSSGPVLTEEAAQWFAELYAPPEDDLANPLLSPLLSEDLSGLPPTVIATAEYDVLRDEGIEYAMRLQGSDVQITHLHYETLPHGFFGFGPLSEAADRAISEVCAATVDLAAAPAEN